MDYRVAVCDDEQQARDFAQACVKQWAQARNLDVEVRAFPTGEAFLFEYAQDQDWDILLLDVEMPGQTGVELAKQVRRENQITQIVFLTGYSDYIAEGYDVSALHYLIKPVSQAKLFTVLNRAVDQLRRDGLSLLLELPGELVRVPMRQVEYLEVRQNYVTIYGGTQAYTVKKTLSALERELDDRFYRVGRSFILNLSKVRKVTKKEVTMLSGAVVPLPRGAYEGLNRAIIEKL